VNDFDRIVEDLTQLAKGKRIWLAYSGGIDSHVLLHLLATSAKLDLKNIHAIHIDHGLSEHSKQWTQHCAEVAAGLQVKFTSIDVVVDEIETLGMEAAARKARYNAIQNCVDADDLVLTAQHQHDQAETLLLQLLRGAGPKGLAGMAKLTQLGQAQLYRPLLEISQAEIEHYAKQHNLNWIEDPSNVETRWARNYIRHDLWPVLELRWPAAAATISRSAQHCAEASELLDELAQSDLASMVISTHSISISALLRLNTARQRNALRFFIHERGMALPSTVCLQQIIDEVCGAKQDAIPLVQWSDFEARRFQDELYLQTIEPTFDAKLILPVSATQRIQLDPQRCLIWQASLGQGFKQALLDEATDWTIRFRQGGERIQLSETHHSSLKHLFQQWQVAPWLRDRIPLVYRQQELIAVVGYAVAYGYSVTEGELGYLPVIELSQ